MGPADSRVGCKDDEQPATGEYLVQWRGLHDGGANGTHIVPVPEPADGEIANSLRRRRCGRNGHDR